MQRIRISLKLKSQAQYIAASLWLVTTQVQTAALLPCLASRCTVSLLAPVRCVLHWIWFCQRCWAWLPSARRSLLQHWWSAPIPPSATVLLELAASAPLSANCSLMHLAARSPATSFVRLSAASSHCSLCAHPSSSSSILARHGAEGPCARIPPSPPPPSSGRALQLGTVRSGHAARLLRMPCSCDKYTCRAHVLLMRSLSAFLFQSLVTVCFLGGSHLVRPIPHAWLKHDMKVCVLCATQKCSCHHAPYTIPLTSLNVFRQRRFFFRTSAGFGEQ